MTARPWATLGRYLLFQLPGWGLGLLVLALLVRRDWLAPRWAVLMASTVVVLDLALYPWLRVAYEPQPERDHPRLLGARAVALAALGPGEEGWVRVGPERWRARLAAGSAAVAEGEALEVRDLQALTLIVARAEAPGPAASRAPGSSSSAQPSDYTPRP